MKAEKAPNSGSPSLPELARPALPARPGQHCSATATPAPPARPRRADWSVSESQSLSPCGQAEKQGAKKGPLHALRTKQSFKGARTKAS